MCQKHPSQERHNDLSQVPPRRQADEQPLMGLWYEFEEYDTVDRYIASRCCADDRPQDAKSSEVLNSGYRAGKNTAVEDCCIEGWFAANQIGRGTPKRGANNKTDIISNGAEAEACNIGKFIGDRRSDRRDALGPEIIDDPAEAVDDEENPLKSD